MQTHIELKNMKLPKLLSDLSHSNQFLKMFSISLLGITAGALILIAVLATRAPIVLTLAPTGEVLSRVEMPKLEDEIRVAVSRYVELRYKWTPETVKAKLTDAQAFVHPNALKAYQASALNVAKFSTEKQVSQRVYVTSVSMDLDKKVISMTGDRISAIQGLKAVGDLKLELSFESGPRTTANPWGIYVVKEREN